MSKVEAHHKQEQSKMKKLFLNIAGVFFVCLAIVGVILPILPTTPFLLVAVGCFAKSSPSMQQKLLDNKIFGPLIHDWQQHRSISCKSKRIALFTIVLSVLWSSYLLNDALLTAFVVLLVIWPFVFLWRLPISR